MSFALPPRSSKPRSRGITAMIDFGPDTFGWTGRAGVADLIACAGPYIDFAKIYALNALLMPESEVAQIVRMYKEAGIVPYSGGILFEYAYREDQLDAMLALLDRLDLRTLELSENYVSLADEERLALISHFHARGFRVIYEFGRKNPEEPLTIADLHRIVSSVAEIGVPHVIVEQSEIDVLADADMAELTRQPWFAQVLVETDPYRFPQQHAQLLTEYGPEINLANVTPGQVLRLEGLRRGIGRAVNYRLLA